MVFDTMLVLVIYGFPGSPPDARAGLGTLISSLRIAIKDIYAPDLESDNVKIHFPEPHEGELNNGLSCYMSWSPEPKYYRSQPQLADLLHVTVRSILKKFVDNNYVLKKKFGDKIIVCTPGYRPEV